MPFQTVQLMQARLAELSADEFRVFGDAMEETGDVKGAARARLAARILAGGVQVERKGRASCFATLAGQWFGFTGKSVNVSAASSVSLSGMDWDGGCRSEYVCVTAECKQSGWPMDKVDYQSWPTCRSGNSGKLGLEKLVLKFQQSGARSSLTIFGSAWTLAGIIGEVAGAESEVSGDVAVVLAATRGLKASYGGVSNYRLSEARRLTGITPERWEAAKAECIRRGLLNRAGAITVKGRNAIGRTDLYILRAA